MLSLPVALTLLPGRLFAQEPEKKQLLIIGRVVDTRSNPLAGVSVSVKGSTVGTITDEKGAFMLYAEISPKTVLLLKQLGLAPLEVRPHDRPQHGQWTITMHEAEHSVDEVVVTGYQNIKKNELTGSIKQVKAIEIMQAGKMSIDQMLAGQVAGMMVLTESGEPSATAKIRIRGTSSILSSKAPLWVLDGIILDDPVEIDHSALSSDDAAYLIGNAIAGINPQDIESINVLKDAAATALYGVRAANGVIVVTTKKGREGPPRVSYSGNVSVNRREYYDELNLMDAAERVQFSQEIIDARLHYDRSTKDVGLEGLLYQRGVKGVFEGRDILNQRDFDAALSKMVNRNTDWYDILFRNSLSHNHTVNLSGGNETTTYYTSLGYNSTQGTAIGSESERYTAMVKLNTWFNKNLYVNFQMNGSITDNAGFYGGVNPSTFARTTSRALPLYNSDGSLYFYESDIAASSLIDPITDPIVINYLNELAETGSEGKVTTLTAKLDTRWNIWDKLRWEFSGSVASQQSEQGSWATEYSHAAAMVRGYNYGEVEPGSKSEEVSKLPYGGIFSSSNAKTVSYTLRNQLGYEKELVQNHVVSLLATSEIRSTVASGYSNTAYGWRKDRGSLVSPLVQAGNWEAIAKAGPLTPTITDNVKNYVSWLGFASYAYKGKAMINGNLRMDGSNQFGDNPKFRFLPVWSVSGRYILTEESFLKDNSVLSYFALRASYGLQGNVDGNTSPDLVAQLEKYDIKRHFDQSTISMLPNPDLRWEKVQAYNVGFDFSLWDKRIGGTVDAYHKLTTDALSSTRVSQVNGILSQKINASEISNSGVEIDLTAFPIRTKNWELSVGLIYSYNWNKLLKVNELIGKKLEDKEILMASKIAGNGLVVGQPLNVLYAYHYAYLDPATGLPIFYDNGSTSWQAADGTVYPNYYVSRETVDLVAVGVTQPPSSGGINISLRYKGFTLRSNLTYSLGAVKRLPSLYNSSTVFSLFDPVRNVSRDYINRWQQPGDEAHTNLPVLYDSETYTNLPQQTLNVGKWRGIVLYDRADIRVVSTDNIRMGSLSLSYIFPDEMLKPLRISGLMLMAQATNLFLLAHEEWHGFDPEQGASANSPLPKTFTLSLNINF
ncbi:MAG: SusC/RagA family TonB-linked outer membrane protein [Prevotellaceae bacterium]|jgi:TonB-linked SusC/RagA family outer membrane protein|nr:SusC/RagA family TonB-linked outer membrane protein [Prevotellaceae bacterium]